MFEPISRKKRTGIAVTDEMKIIAQVYNNSKQLPLFLERLQKEKSKL
jgi:hypothetical protein